MLMRGLSVLLMVVVSLSAAWFAEGAENPAAAAAAGVGAAPVGGALADTGVVEPGAGYQAIGTVKARHAKEIKASNWSVGAETMDRDFTIFKNWKQHLGPLGAKKARLQSGWAKTEKERGKYDWAWLDEIVQDMVGQGVEPWMCICYGNPIYPGGGETGLGGIWPSTEEALAAWDRYVGALVKRYKAHVDEWEVWNEPSLRRGEAQSARGYADFLIRTAEAIRREQPNARILGLSLPGLPMEWARLVLERLKEKGKLDLLDELTYHPYSFNPDASYGGVEKLREMARSYSTKIIIRQGENGAPSVRGGFGAIANHDWSEERQAKWALRRLLGDLGRDIPTSYFSICDMAYPGRVNYKGLLAINPDKTVHHAKEGYYAVQHLAAIFDDSVKRVADFKGRVEDGAKGARYTLFGYRTDGGGFIATVWRSDKAPGMEVKLQPVTVVLPGAKFTRPVWVDVRTGKVFSIDASMWTQDADGATFRKLSVYDSPVLIADGSAIPMK